MLLHKLLIELLTAALLQSTSLQCNITSNLLSPSYVVESSAVINGNISVNKYTTTKSGLTIVIANTDGPMVNGYFCLATQAHDDNGLPHCLEHLTFTGSEDYPYKGAFHLIASRCLSPMTNAFTGTDLTCYVNSHVGKDGFLTFLPIFMDHILYPTLEPSAFVTEVHHVTGEGLDGGVLYSEILARNDDANKFATLDALYKDSGHGSYTGGALKNLQENTTNELIVAYHKQFYRSENLCITICGDVTIDEVVTSIQQIEKKIVSKPKLPKWKRPWTAVLPVLDTTIVRTLIPSDNDDFAEIYIAWRGPNCATEYRKLLSSTVLLTYVSSTAVAGDLFAKGVSIETIGNSNTALCFKFTGVLVQNVDLIYPKLNARLVNISEGIEKIDTVKIKAIINDKLMSLRNQLETSPHEIISNQIANHFLYGKSSSDFHSVLNGENELNFLLAVSDSHWIGVLNEYFINKKYVQSTGIPSQSERDRLNKEDNERIENRIKTLGPDGLKRKADELEAAIKFNSRPVPESIINSVPIANTDNIKFHDVSIYCSTCLNDDPPPALDIKSWPMYSEAYDIRSDYVYVIVTLFTGQIEAALRPYVYLLLKLINDLPIVHKDSDVVALNNFKPLKTDYRIGLTYHRKAFSCGLLSQTASFTMQVKRDEYEMGAKYLVAKLQDTVFHSNNIKDAANSLLYYVTDPNTDVTFTAMDLLRTMYYKSDSNTKSFSVINQKHFLTNLVTMLNDDEHHQIIDDVNNLRNILVSPDNLAIHVATDFTVLSASSTDLNGPWKDFNFNPDSKKLNVVFDWEVMVDPSTVASQGEVIGLNSTNTAYLIHSSPGVKYFNDSDLAPLTVALSYCSQIGGPMWQRVRGSGYTYFYALELIPEEGVIQLQLVQASNMVSAFNEMLNIINELTHPDADWEGGLVDSAKSSTIYDIVSRFQKIDDVPLETMLLSFRKVSPDYRKNLLSEITAVTIDDLKRVTQLYLTRMFSTTESKTAIVCNANDATVISKGFEKFGFILPVRYSWEDSLLGQL